MFVFLKLIMKLQKIINNPSFYLNVLCRKVRNQILARLNPHKLASVLYTDTIGGG